MGKFNMLDINNPYKCLFVKTNNMYGGPWVSFDYNSATTYFILKNTFAKAGHPFPMILFCGMDVRVIKSDFRPAWLDHACRECKIYEESVSKMTNFYLEEDIDYSQYDVVYTEDPILKSQTIFSNPNTLFVYSDGEHFKRTPQTHYDLFLDHLQWDFPHTIEKHNLFKNENKADAYVEYRTRSIRGIHDKIFDSTKIKCITKTFLDANKSCYGMTKPLQNGISYWANLGASKYHVMLPVNGNKRIGQCLIDAASIDSINIGKSSHKNHFIHPDLIAEDVHEAINKIKKVESSKSLYHEALFYQRNQIRSCQKNFIEIISKSINIKLYNK